ncbi:MAG: TldD/PmbA family protein [Brevinematia bacterium]
MDKLREFMFEILSFVNKGDVTGYRSDEYSIDFEMDRLKSVENTSSSAVGLRVFKDGRVGNSFINSFGVEDKDTLLKNVFDTLKFGDKQDFNLPEKQELPDVKIFDENFYAVTKEILIEKGFELLKRLKKIGKDVKVNIHFSKGVIENHLLNTGGFEGTYKESDFSVLLNLTEVEKNGGILSVSEMDSFNRVDLTELDRMCDRLEEKYGFARKKMRVKSGYFPVLFSPEALSLILEPVEIAANGKTLYRKISVFENRENDIVATDMLTIYDNPLYDFGSGSYPFDDEGVVPRKLTVIEKGVFKNFIFDLFTASQLSRESTGHARRSVSSLPSPSFSNIFIETGSSSFSDMLSSIDYGLLVYSFLGEGMSNILAGDFSVNVEFGFLVEKGRIRGRVKDVMLAGNAFDAIKNIKMIENRQYKHGSLYAPHILFDNLSVMG